MSLNLLHEREKERAADAVKINNGRKPQFGDHMRNPWAGEINPHRDGYFVRARRVTGKFNPGLWYQMTDKKGKFWEIDGQYAIFIDHLEVK
ncbi:hypothetical protein KKI93_20220 [Xenorhabdus bovienii]|uniref:hypothetical protein n=1 Tax=Xenorhabdus bovienii TaxID=40576 RepID=UPI0023B2CA6A|nr:hypothetical protein [Xenorhabdus bovienii]MDE9566302.1 hypothetical protein [Xenorhabdus bovienii]